MSNSNHNQERSKAYFARKSEEIKALNPKLFDKQRPSVLTKRIKEQIRQALPHIGEGVVNKFLMYWVKRDRYLSATIMCPSRMNLDGSFAEKVTEKEKAYAKNELRRKRAAKKSRTSPQGRRPTAKKLAPSDAALRQRAILEKAGKGLNFPIQSKKKPEVEVRVKKRKTLSLKKEGGDD